MVHLMKFCKTKKSLCLKYLIVALDGYLFSTVLSQPDMLIYYSFNILCFILKYINKRLHKNKKNQT